MVLLSVHQVEAIPPASTQDLYDWHDVILLGKMISKNSTFSPTHFSYEIKVEKYLKNPQPYGIINAAGLNRLNPHLANTVFEVGDRGLFFLNNYTQKYDSNNPFTISIRSIKAQPEWDLCNLFDKEIPREHWVFGPAHVSPKISQGNETDIDNFSTNKEILINYDFLNHTPETKYFEFGASITQWDNSTRPVVFRESRIFSLEPCTVYKTITWSFVPTKAGHYSFESYDPLGTRFEIGFAVHDESSSEFDYPVPGSGIIQDTDRNKVTSHLLSPLKQFKSGVAIGDIQCRQDLQLIFRTIDNSPICVKSLTAEKLNLRGYAYGVWFPSPSMSPNLSKLDSDKHEDCMNTDMKLVYKGITHKDPYLVKVAWNPYDLKRDQVVNFEIQMFDVNTKPLQDVVYDFVWKTGPDSGVVDDRLVDFGKIQSDVLPIKTADPCYISVGFKTWKIDLDNNT